jgi:hypothetical protein
MALDIMSPAQPRMVLWGQLTRIRAHSMWHLRLRKFVKFGCGVIVGGFAMSAATSSYEIMVSILLIACSRGRSFFCLLRTVDCSKDLTRP